MYKIDLHTHSTLSKDGGISAEEYEKALKDKKLDYIAVTDHNEIDFAISLNRKLGDKVIVGEEIKTTKGEIVGLFLKKKIEPHQSFEATIEQIHKQNGLAYLPHPFDIRRSGADMGTVLKNYGQIDIIEKFNARIITPGVHKKITKFIKAHPKSYAASSDSHSSWELGKTYTLVKERPARDNLAGLLKSPELAKKTMSLKGFLAPSWNKLSKKYLKKNNRG